MLGISPILSVLLLLMIAIALCFVALGVLGIYFTESVSKNIEGYSSFCTGNSANLVIRNEGTETILLSDPSPVDFNMLGNMVPNPGFELDENGDSQPDGWGERVLDTLGVVIVTDLSNSMADCMDDKLITPDMDTVLLLHFDDVNHVEDSSGNYNHGGIMGGGLDCSVPGKLSYGCSFDSQDDLIMIDSLNGDNSNEGTYAFWMYYREPAISGQHDGVLNSHSLNPYMYIANDLSINAFIYGAGIWEVRLYTQAGTVELNEWSFYTVTYNSTEAYFYKNGTLIAQYTPVTGNFVPSSDFHIGSDRLIIDRYLDGIMDEVIVLDRSLTPQEVSGLYQDQLSGERFVPDGNTILLMHMDEGRHLGIAEDRSGYGNNGTLQGAVLNDSGVFGSALWLEADGDQISFGNPESLQLTGDLTLSFWAYPFDVSQYRQNPIYKAYGGEFGLTMETDGSLSYFHGPCGSECTPYMSYSWEDLFQDNTWVHIAIVRDVSEQTIQLYKNGEYIIPTGTSSWQTPMAGDNPFLVGNGYTSSFDGLLDEIAVYNRPLTREEVMSLAKAVVHKECAKVTTDDDTLLWMSMEEDNQVLDSSWNENHGLVSNDVDCRVPGQLGYGCEFDGDDDFIWVRDSESLNITGNMTITAWVNSDFSDDYHIIVEKGEAAEYSYRLYTYSNELGFGYSAGGSDMTAVFTDPYASEPTIPRNTWAHVAATRGWNGTGFDITLYIDGQVASTGNLNGSAHPSDVGLSIGSSAYQTSFFNGSMDELVIYDRVLSQDEISNVVYGPQSIGVEAGPDSDTAFLMHMNDNRDFRMIDSSVYQNHGIIHGKIDCTVDGFLGSGCEFDGFTGMINLGDLQTNGTTNLTVAAWIFHYDGGDDRVVCKSTGTSIPSHVLCMGAPSNTVRVRLGTDESTNEDQYDAGPYILHEWQHVAFTFGDSRIRIYINGEEIEDFEKNGSILNSDQPVFIGNVNFVDPRYFNGKIDEVVILNRTLTKEEIEFLAMDCLPCPDDGLDDIPSRCRYETTLCPPQRPTEEESYAPESWDFGSFQSPEYSRVDYSVQSGTEPTLNCYPIEGGCDGDTVCSGLGLIYNGSFEIGPAVQRDQCQLGECESGYTYDNCYWMPRTTHWMNVCPNPPWANGSYYRVYTCRESCIGDENPYDGCGVCDFLNRTGCQTTTACIDDEHDHDRGENDIFTWRPYSPGCLPQECDTGNTRYSSYVCTETCDTGYTECSECSSCFETCCCLDTSYERECEQLVDYCCDSILCQQTYDGCCDDRYLWCRNETYYCCDPLSTCIPNLPGDPLATPCTPGFIGGVPDPGSSCDSGFWQCRADSGSCYVCDAVAIRLAKKLDKVLVGNLINRTIANVSLVAYGDQVSSVTESSRSLDIMLDNISNYHADMGETCLSCAVEKARQLLRQMPSTKRFMVLMSDGEANKCKDGRDHGQAGCDAIAEAVSEAVGACDDDGITIYAVSFGRSAGEETLQMVSSQGCEGSKFFDGRSPEELEDIYIAIARLIGSAGIDNTQSVFGDNAMMLQASEIIPVAESERFNVYHDGTGMSYDLWLYSNLTLDPTTGASLDIAVHFYDSEGNEIIPGGVVVANFTESHNLRHDSFNVTVPPNAAQASIKFSFEGEPSETDVIFVDDVYFGPPITCRKEESSWICGDIIITKTSDDGEMYPYMQSGYVDPTQPFMIKDANCKEHCSYEITTISNRIGEDVIC